MDGVIVINKPFGRTSHDMIYFVRKTLGIKKAGHTGTLDPDATGVLPVCLGKATKAADLLTCADKAYSAELVLGMTTDTLDGSGEILAEQPHEYVTEEMLREKIKEFTGEIYQIPPMFSAIKKDGKKLYELAREGVTVERTKRLVRIDKIELLSYDRKSGIARIDVECSKGTYIRTLCEDIGMALGCGAYMNRLERTKSGMFSLEESYTTEEIREAFEKGRIEEIITPVWKLFPMYPQITLNEKQAEKVTFGAKVKMSGLTEGEAYRLFAPDGKFLAISECSNGFLVLKKAFWQ